MQNSHYFRRSVLVAAALLSSSSTLVLGQQAGVGAAYGTRDPHVCKDKKTPARGAPSSAQAVEYVTCEREGLHAKELYLVDAVKVDVGTGRPFSLAADPYLSDVDPAFPVYAIKGSYKEYQCDPEVNNPRLPQYNNGGKNCTLREFPKASGKCWRTTLGEWRCDMTYDEADPAPKRNVAPPARGGGH